MTDRSELRERSLTAQGRGKAYWLYVVECAGTDEARLVRIEDPFPKQQFEKKVADGAKRAHRVDEVKNRHAALGATPVERKLSDD